MKGYVGLRESCISLVVLKMYFNTDRRHITEQEKIMLQKRSERRDSGGQLKRSVLESMKLHPL